MGATCHVGSVPEATRERTAAADGAGRASARAPGVSRELAQGVRAARAAGHAHARGPTSATARARVQGWAKRRARGCAHERAPHRVRRVAPQAAGWGERARQGSDRGGKSTMAPVTRRAAAAKKGGATPAASKQGHLRKAKTTTWQRFLQGVVIAAAVFAVGAGWGVYLKQIPPEYAAVVVLVSAFVLRVGLAGAIG